MRTPTANSLVPKTALPGFDAKASLVKAAVSGGQQTKHESSNVNVPAPSHGQEPQQPLEESNESLEPRPNTFELVGGGINSDLRTVRILGLGRENVIPQSGFILTTKEADAASLPHDYSKSPLTPEDVVAKLFTMESEGTIDRLQDANAGGSNDYYGMDADQSATDMGGSMSSLPLFSDVGPSVDVRMEATPGLSIHVTNSETTEPVHSVPTNSPRKLRGMDSDQMSFAAATASWTSRSSFNNEDQALHELTKRATESPEHSRFHGETMDRVNMWIHRQAENVIPESPTLSVSNPIHLQWKDEDCQIEASQNNFDGTASSSAIVPKPNDAALAPGQTSISDAKQKWEQGEKEIAQFERSLQIEHGLQVLYVVEDSCCLFRSVAEAIFGSQEHHQRVREDCIQYMRQNISRFSRSVGIGYFDALENLSTPGTDLELQAIADTYGAIVEIYQIGCSYPFKLYPIERNSEHPAKIVKICVLAPNIYHGLVPISRTEGEIVMSEVVKKLDNLNRKQDGWESEEDEDLKQAILLSLQESTQSSHDGSSSKTFQPEVFQKPPLAPSVSVASIGSSSAVQHPRKLDRILKIAGGVSSSSLHPLSGSPANGSHSGSSMGDEEFQALQAALEMSLHESNNQNHGTILQQMDDFSPPKSFNKRNRRVSFSEDFRDGNETEGRYGRRPSPPLDYQTDQDEDLKAAIELSQRDFESKSAEDSDSQSPKRWKGKGRAE
ncbi:OTU domain-containing protein 5 [Phlyctochytrium planicorne]|nr:OTU domain-containing protein 5 [Phlyctochytrium planicorne]